MTTAASDRRVVLVTRRTRLDTLIARHNTLGQAKFYVEHLGADFSDYLKESEAYAASLRVTVQALQAWGRYQIVDRSLLANFVFAPSDIVVALGQDGLVANTMKYLEGQPLVGLNPEPSRWDGVLLPFQPADLGAILPGVATEQRNTRLVTMAEARLSDGQVLRAVNDLFIGPRSHTSALYDLSYGGQTEFQSSSGLIVSTGLGSTAWLKSIVTGSLSIARSVGASTDEEDYQPMTDQLAGLFTGQRLDRPLRLLETAGRDQGKQAGLLGLLKLFQQLCSRAGALPIAEPLANRRQDVGRRR